MIGILLAMDVLAGLDVDEMHAVKQVMRAVVARDADALLELSAPEDANPWTWADDYGGQTLRLKMPPGSVASWPGSILRRSDRHNWCGVAVEVWAEGYGMTDLTLELDLERQVDGSTRAVFVGLHVV